MSRNVPDKLTQAIEATEALVAATREAHGLLKDARRVLRDLRDATAAAEAAAVKAAEQQAEQVLAPVITEALDEVGEATRKTIAAAEQRVYARFDTLAAILMGEDRDGPALTDLARQWRARRTPRPPSHDTGLGGR